MSDFYFAQTVSPQIINSILIGSVAFLVSIGCVVLIAQYVFFGISIYKVAVLQDFSKPWIAWLPFARSYLFGKIGDSLNQKAGHPSNRRIFLFILSVIKVVFSAIFIGFTIKFISDIINFVFSTTGYDSIISFLQMIDDDIITNVIFTYFSDFISLLISFVFLLIFYIWFFIVNMKNYNLLYKEYAISSAEVFTLIAIISYLFLLIFIPPLFLLVLLCKRLTISDV